MSNNSISSLLPYNIHHYVQHKCHPTKRESGTEVGQTSNIHLLKKVPYTQSHTDDDEITVTLALSLVKRLNIHHELVDYRNDMTTGCYLCE